MFTFFCANTSLNFFFAIFFLVLVQVNFLTKLVALRPGKTVHEMIKNVMQGKDEGADNYGSGEGSPNGPNFSGGIAGKVRSVAQ